MATMTLKELSEKLGLSQTTVSRALNGFPEVSEKTRARVWSAANKYNYRPNKRAKSLATGKTKTIGHIIPFISEREVMNPVFAEVIAGASQTYHQHGYDLMLSVVDSDDIDFYQSYFARGSVDGVIVHHPCKDDRRIEILNKIGVPFVFHGRVSDTASDYSWIDIDNEAAFYQATKLLIDLGHQRIGLINGNEQLDFSWSRRKGYMQALEENNIPLDLEIMSTSELTLLHGLNAVGTMLALPNPPSAFLASSYIVALGVSRAIREANLVVGKDVSIVIHDDELSYFDNGGEVPLFTGTRSSSRMAGIQAAKMLLDIIDDPSRAPMHKLLEAPLTIGRSTGPCKSK